MAFLLCICGHPAVAEYLAPRIAVQLCDTYDNEGTVLHWAVEMNQLSIVEYLVNSCEFDVTLRDKVCA